MQVWLVKYSDGGDYCGTISVHRSSEGAEKMKTEANAEEAKDGGMLHHYVTGPYELHD